MSNSMKKHKGTAKYWEFCIDWEDGTMLWLSLKELKDNNPAEVDQYTNTKGLTYHPVFRWKVNNTLRKKDIIVAKIATRNMSKDRIKFGIKIPNNVSECYILDDTNNTSL